VEGGAVPQWQIDVSHPKLNKSRLITGNDKLMVERKAVEQHHIWDGEWCARVRTEVAKAEVRLCQTVLVDALAQEIGANWDTLKDTSPFPETPPRAPTDELPPEPPPLPKSLDPELERRWAPFPKALAKLKLEREQRYETWLKLKLQIEAGREQYLQWLADWEERNHDYLQARDERLSRFPQVIESLLARFWEQRQAPALPADIKIALNSNWRIPVKASLLPDSRIVVIDCSLPPLASLPRLKEVRYTASRDTFNEFMLRSAEINQLYEDLLYQICLATLHLVFLFDYHRGIYASVFNGWVTVTDPATGSDARACILSVNVDREAFATINLARVEPKACFRSFKGVGSTQLHETVPVAPLVRGNRDDPRFVESREIANQIREGTNLAAIGWEDFEHLIREIFETEFKTAGGDVRVTRASRDWGVDAVAFDPDPVRGGKIVIQAKRYTNTVEVSAVRDLYGTVMNEGAMKGILVTTSTFGPDAYSFAKDKPLTLLDGSNLLHLLERHGRRAYIDLAEAKLLNQTPLARTNLSSNSASRESTSDRQ
jgi:restriction system protein